MSAIQQLLTDHIDIWTAAETEKGSGRGRASSSAASVYGIKKLRELILELAVRGKLVPQDSNDIPASELVKRIKIEKTKLLENGSLKKSKSLPPIEGEEKSSPLPDGWEWIRLEDITSIRGGSTPSMNNSEYWGGDIPWISPKDMHGGDIVGSELMITKKAITDTNLELIPIGSVLIVGRSGILKRKLPAQITAIPCTVNQDIKAITPIQPLSDRYLQLIFFGNERDILARDVKQGTTVQSLVYESLFSRPFGLPPEAEQHRIVAKIDELMALCDHLEARHSDAADAHEQLVSHLLSTLIQSQSAVDFSFNWQRIAAHFDTLFTTEASIDTLKQTLLQLAVMGKLVAQDPNDEPSSELLKRIKAEKALLLAEGKIKKESPLPLINLENSPFELPEGWSWVRMADICVQITDGTHQTPKYVPIGRPFLSAQNVKPFRFIPAAHRFVSQDDFDKLRKNRIPEKGDILLTRVGAMIGEAAVIDVEFEFAFYVSLGLLKPSKKNLNSDFIVLWLNSPIGTSTSIKNTLGRGVSAGNLNLSLIRNFLIGLPPLNEQHRIVSRIGELMALCDRLKSCIAKTNQLQKNLADVLVERAVLA